MSPRDVDTGLTEPTAEQPTYEEEEERRPRPLRGLFWLVGIVGLIAVLVLGSQAAGLWPDFSNPFGKKETDRSQPALLQSIRDLSRYVAAEGNFQVVIDVQRNRNHVPDFLVNRRTLFVGAGSVEAYVDFAKLADGAITVSDDGKSVSIRLPDPQLAPPKLDLEHSYVFSEQRGLVDWVNDVFNGDPNRQNQVYQLAEDRIAAAATESGLPERARDNTRKMLEGLFRSLGYTSITVTYAAP
jgi:Protein of unknown function (DUF4230)